MEKILSVLRQNWKRYLISSIVTFLLGFLLVIYSEIDSIGLGSFKDGSFTGLLFVAVRAGIKALLEGAFAIFKK